MNERTREKFFFFLTEFTRSHLGRESDQRRRSQFVFNGHCPWQGEWLAEAQGLRGSARQGKGAQCGCPKGTSVAGANQAMGPRGKKRKPAWRGTDEAFGSPRGCPKAVGHTPPAGEAEARIVLDRVCRASHAVCSLN